MSNELGRHQEEQANSRRHPMTKINANMVKSARARIAKVINNIKDIIESLPEDQYLTKRIIGEIFGAVETLMGIFNSCEISQITKGVGENSKKINSIINITEIHSKHLEKLKISPGKLKEIVTALLQNNLAQLNNEKSHTLEMGYKAQIGITNLVQQTQNKDSVDQLAPKMLKLIFKHLQDQADLQGL